MVVVLNPQTSLRPSAKEQTWSYNMEKNLISEV